MKRLSVLAAIGLSACGGGGDWRATAIADAERQIRAQVSDPAAEFTRIQFTGDEQTGQTCGHVDAASPGGVARSMGRFIIFIDGSAPLVEGGIGKTFTAKQDFDWQWLNQCTNLGYNS